MPTPRNRNRVRSTTSAGKYQIVRISDGVPIVTSTGFSGVTWNEQCSDSTQPYPYTIDTSLNILSRRADPYSFSGTWPRDGTTRYVAEGYNPQARNSYVFTPTVQPINWLYWQTKALANLNPNRAVLDLPLFLFEFKDFPAMLRNLGEVLSRRMHPKAVPEGYLAYSFGWAPLISDLFSLIDLQKSIEDRLAYLKRLESGTRVQRSLGESVLIDSVTPNGYTTASLGSPVTADMAYKEVHRAWFTANAKLVNPLPPASDQYDLARRLSLGGGFSAATLWNMVPWSFLIDYFWNIGDFLEATSGIVKTRTTRMCIMVKIESTSTMTNIRLKPGVSSVGDTMSSVSKNRGVYPNPIPWIVPFPFLSNGQMANLGALLTVNALRAF
jgi:hypothetical protein